MANLDSNIIKNLISLAREYPKSFFRQLNMDNWRTLKRAVLNESPREIISNARKLLQKTSSDSVKGIESKINKFVKTIPVSQEVKACIFVSHEASRTGAPLIILNLAKDLKKRHEVLPIQILCDGGDLESEFNEIGPTYKLHFYHNKPLLKQEMDILLSKIQDKVTVQKAYVNSEGSTKILPYLSKKKLAPIITLLHEMGDYYPEKSWKHINTNSDFVVFPAEFVKEKALGNSHFDAKKIRIYGQGLMKPELLKQNKLEAKANLCDTLNIPLDSVVILGCGSPIGRKGTDLFVTTAISVLNKREKEGKPLPYFVWLGEAPNAEFQIWVKRDIEKSRNRKHIKLVGGFKEVSQFFLGSDFFYLTSRGDPFPCVVHEALASKLPVIAFENTGGSIEIISQNHGKILPYGDIFAAVNCIEEYLDKSLVSLGTNFDNLEDYFSFERYSDQLLALK